MYIVMTNEGLKGKNARKNLSSIGIGEMLVVVGAAYLAPTGKISSTFTITPDGLSVRLATGKVYS
jgi:hypothetical protein